MAPTFTSVFIKSPLILKSKKMNLRISVSGSPLRFPSEKPGRQGHFKYSFFTSCSLLTSPVNFSPFHLRTLPFLPPHFYHFHCITPSRGRRSPQSPPSRSKFPLSFPAVLIPGTQEHFLFLSPPSVFPVSSSFPVSFLFPVGRSPVRKEDFRLKV